MGGCCQLFTISVSQRTPRPSWILTLHKLYARLHSSVNTKHPPWDNQLEIQEWASVQRCIIWLWVTMSVEWPGARQPSLCPPMQKSLSLTFMKMVQRKRQRIWLTVTVKAGIKPRYRNRNRNRYIEHEATKICNSDKNLRLRRMPT